MKRKRIHKAVRIEKGKRAVVGFGSEFALCGCVCVLGVPVRGPGRRAAPQPVHDATLPGF